MVQIPKSHVQNGIWDTQGAILANVFIPLMIEKLQKLGSQKFQGKCDCQQIYHKS